MERMGASELLISCPPSRESAVATPRARCRGGPGSCPTAPRACAGRRPAGNACRAAAPTCRAARRSGARAFERRHRAPGSAPFSDARARFSRQQVREPQRGDRLPEDRARRFPEEQPRRSFVREAAAARRRRRRAPPRRPRPSPCASSAQALHLTQPMVPQRVAELVQIGQHRRRAPFSRRARARAPAPKNRRRGTTSAPTTSS